MAIRTGRGRVALSLAVALCLWTGIALARSRLLLLPGLHARYFTTIDWSAPPARSTIDPVMTTQQVSRGWGFTPPDSFSVRWAGYLFVDHPGAYTFATTSDDGSAIDIDDQPVVANGGIHGTVTREGRVRLTRGPHAITLEYMQAGGPYQLEWSWAREGDVLAPVPAWRLSTRPRNRLTLALVDALDWVWPAAALLAVILFGRLAFLFGYWPRRDNNSASTPAEPALPAWHGQRALICLAFFVVLTVVQTWPLATDPAHLSRNDNADTQLNEWTLAWFAHQLPRDPLHIFDGNMFYPEHRTLAYSETMIVQDVIAAPMLWLGASPVLAFNLMLLAGFTLTGWAMCLVMARWTGDWAAGLAAGVMMAFNAHTLTRMPHLQAQHVEFLPLALMSLDALLRRPRWASAIWLAIWFTLQALTSVYLLVFMTIALAVAVLARPEDWSGRRLIVLAPMLALAAAAAGAALVPFLLPYWRLHSEGFVRSLDEVGFYAAHARDYLTTPSRFDASADGGAALFPGVVALALAGVAIVSRKAFTDARARMCLAFGLCGVLLSFGPAVAPGYEFFYSTIPILQGIRTTARFGYLGLVAIAVLGGYGVAVLRRLLAHRPAWNATVSLAVLALVCIEPMAMPIGYARFDGIPSIYALPAADPHAIVAEMPLARPEKQFRNAPYVLASTLNWKPLLNGYSGFTPKSYDRHYSEMSGFPDRQSIDALRAAGVTDVFVDFNGLDPDGAQALDREPALHRITADGSIAFYRLDPAPPRP